MTGSTERSRVTRLGVQEWERLSALATMPLPFGAAPWVRWGQVVGGGLVFAPVQVRWSDAGDFLVPLCVTGSAGRIGAFGYGMVCPLPGLRDGALPAFGELSAVLCRELSLTGLRTLLPPLSAAAVLDRVAAHWRGDAGRLTYLLDLTDGADCVWKRALGKARTDVRRAERHGLLAGQPRAGDAAAVADLYAQTLRRNGVARADQGLDFGFLTEERADVITRVVRGGDGVQAVAAFAVGAGTAYHVMQTTSAVGRQTRAGYLAFWSAISALAASGVRRADLGSAVGRGHERFKLAWGSVSLATRQLAWPEGER